MSKRVNARLEDELGRKLSYLQAQTGKTATQILQASLEAYFEKVASPEGPRKLLQDFVGSGSAESDLSQNYKAVLTASLEKKGSPQRRRGGRNDHR